MDKHLFLGANTPDGFIHRFDKVIEMYDLKKLYILKGGNGIGKSTFIRSFAEAFEGTRIFFYCSSDPKSLYGVIIEDLRIGIIDGTAPHMIDPKYPGIIDEIIDLGKFINTRKVKAAKEQIDAINAKKSRHYSAAFHHLDQARTLHRELEDFYKDAVCFDKVNALCNKLITSAKLEAGVIRRNSDLENSTK